MVSGGPVLSAQLEANTDVLDAAMLAADRQFDQITASIAAKAKALDGKLSAVGKGFGAGLEGRAAQVDGTITAMQARINGMVSTGAAGGSARGSAEFLQEAERASSAVRALEARLDPAVAALHRYEAAQESVARAVETGAIDQAKATSILQQSYREFETAIDGLSGGAGRLEAELSSVQARINGMFASSGRGAQASAEFFRETEAAADGVRALQAQLDPATAALHRFEAAQQTVGNALRLGAIQQAEADRTLALAHQRYAAVSGVIGKAPAAYRQVGAAAQQAGYQIGDFAVQVASGQNPLVAFTQQASQLLGFFGPIGAVMGAGAAIAGGLAVAFWDMGDGADESEKATKALADAVETYRAAAEAAQLTTGELAEKYGDLGGVVQDINKRMAEAGRVDALEAVSEAFRKLSGALADVSSVELEKLSQALDRSTSGQDRAAAAADLSKSRFTALRAVLADVRDEFETDAAGALKIAEATVKLSEAKGPQDQARAANEMAAALLEVYGSYEKMPTPAREVYTRVQETAEKAAEAAGAVGTLDSKLSSAAERARLLKDRMAEIADASAAAALEGVSARRVAELRFEFRDDPVALAGKLAAEKFDAENKITQDMNPFFVAGVQMRRDAVIADAEATARAEKALADWKKEVQAGSRAVKASTKDQEKARDAVTDATNKIREMATAKLAERDAVELSGDALSMHNALVEAAAIKQDLLNKAAKEGLSVSPEQLAQLDALTAGYVALAVETDGQARAADEAKEANSQLFDTLAGAVRNVDSFADALRNLALALAEVALKGALLGEGPAAGLAQSLGAALGSAFGSASNGTAYSNASLASQYAAYGAGKLTPRADGGPVLPGGGYWVGEKGPEPFFPEVGGRILSVAQSQAALRAPVAPSGGGGDSRGDIILNVDAKGAQIGAAEQIVAKMRAFVQGPEFKRAMDAAQLRRGA